MIVAWTDEAWNDYLYWQEQGDKKKVKRINKLIKDIKRHPFEGLGKPESLKHDLAGKWSRRIDSKDRIIYALINKEAVIFSCKDHYDD